ncbi:MAG TPA: FAD-linked oxidase C-terminal domain-containing protein [Chloroflexia bacterium]|nr:FAD-linked oxidase C-terminal domain-containing protein [Chloroflexia bacterium]
MDKQALVAELLKIFGPDGVLHDPEDVLVYEYDFSPDHNLPEAVVFPGTTEQISALLALAQRENIPVTPRGAGTGLSGGSIPVRGGVVVAMARMKKLLKLDIPNRYAVVQPGHVNLELSTEIAPSGYFFAPDPASQKASTIGGNLALNAGGPHCLAYGTTTNHILGLEMVLPGGETVRVGSPAPDRPGYDLTGFIVGSEGTLGIVTDATVKLMKQPEAVSTFLALFNDVGSASDAVSAVIGHGIVPAALEMMDQVSIRMVEEAMQAGYPPEAGAVLLIEVDGLNESIDELTGTIIKICQESGAFDVKSATTEEARTKLWAGRKGAAGAFGRIAPNFYLHDGVVPRSKLPEVLRRVEEIGKEYDLPIANLFHAGDGNLHPNILFDIRVPGVMQKVMEAGEKILHLCVEVGGTISGEHGIGTEKQDYMTWIYSEDDLETMRKVKNIFNPDEVVNPWKVFPTRKSCGEISLKMRILKALPGMDEAWI